MAASQLPQYTELLNQRLKVSATPCAQVSVCLSLPAYVSVCVCVRLCMCATASTTAACTPTSCSAPYLLQLVNSCATAPKERQLVAQGHKHRHCGPVVLVLWACILFGLLLLLAAGGLSNDEQDAGRAQC